MKLFIKQISILFILVAIVIVSIEWKYRHYISPIELTFLKYDIQKDSVNLLYIGNSHMGAFGRQKMFEKDVVQNLSIGGQDLFHIKTILEKTIPESPKLKTIVLGLDYELIGYDYVIANQMWKDRLYYNYTKKLYSDNIGDLLMAHSHFYKSNRDLSLLFKEIKPFNNESITNDENHFIPKKNKLDVTQQCLNRAKEHSYVKFDSKLKIKNKNYFEDIVFLCKKYNIDLICVTTAKQKLYEENFNPECIKIAKELFLPLIKKHSVEYINLWQNSSFNSNDFVDADHLNKNGVEKTIDHIKKQISAF